MKPGYKQTEVGVIPEEWSIRPLGLICDVRDGTHESPRFFKDGIPFVTSKNIVDGRLDLENVSFISKSDAFEFDKRSKVDRNDILLSMIGTIGSAVLVDCEPAFCIKNVALIKPRKVAPTYLIRLINAPVFQKYLADNLDGGIQKFISLGKLRQLFIPLPDEAEQRAIATALSDVDGLLGGLDRLIAKKRDLKQAAMQQLLTSQTRLPGFHGEWEVKRLGDVITHCFSGATPRRNRPEFYKGNIRWITSGELNYNVITNTIEKISTEAVAETNLTIHPVGTFLMAITGLEAEGTRGACGIVGAPSTTNQSCMAVFPTAALAGEYLFHYYVFRGKFLALQYCQGTKQQSYTASLVKQLPIDLPPTLPEQTAIAEVLTEMDGELAVLEQRREKTRALKQAMMQELLTGRIRLVASSGATE